MVAEPEGLTTHIHKSDAV